MKKLLIILFAISFKLSAQTYCAPATVLFAKWDSLGVSADSTRKYLVNNTIDSLISKGIWSELDMLEVWTSHNKTASLVDWKNPNRVATVTNDYTGAFVVDGYWKGNNSNFRINTNYNPSAGTKFTQNSNSFGAYIVDRNLENKPDISAFVSTTGNQVISESTTSSYFIYNNTATQKTAIEWGGTGLFACKRTASNSYNCTNGGYNNGSAFTDASVSVPNANFYAFCKNISGTQSLFSIKKQRYVFAGSGNFSIYDLNNIIEEQFLHPLGLCPTKRLTLSGNSITANNGYALQTIVALNDFANLDVNVRGISGYKTGQIATDAITNIYPFTKNWLTKNVYVVWEFTNDMQLGGATASQAYSHMVAYLDTLRVKQPDAIIVCVTMLPRSTIVTQNPSDLNDTTYINGMVRVKMVRDHHADYIIDVGSDSVMGLYGQNTNTTYYNTDAIHPNLVGSQRLTDNYFYPLLHSLGL